MWNDKKGQKSHCSKKVPKYTMLYVRKSRRSQKSFICQFSKSNQGYILMIGYGIGIYILKLHSTIVPPFRISNQELQERENKMETQTYLNHCKVLHYFEFFSSWFSSFNWQKGRNFKMIFPVPVYNPNSNNSFSSFFRKWHQNCKEKNIIWDYIVHFLSFQTLERREARPLLCVLLSKVIVDRYTMISFGRLLS